MTGEITVLSREDGSGTRGAFIELFGIEQKNDAGEKEDMTTDDAQITNSTSVMMTTVQGNPKAIGYISLGSLDESVVKAVEIDGAAPTVENVKAGTYKVVRPFNIATKGEASEVAQDFIHFIMSADGQKTVISPLMMRLRLMRHPAFPARSLLAVPPLLRRSWKS